MGLQVAITGTAVEVTMFTRTLFWVMLNHLVLLPLFLVEPPLLGTLPRRTRAHAIDPRHRALFEVKVLALAGFHAVHE